MNVLNAFKNIVSQSEPFLTTLTGSIRRLAFNRSADGCLERQLLTNIPEISFQRLARTTILSSIQLTSHATRSQEILSCSGSRVLSTSHSSRSSTLRGIYRQGHSLLGITKEPLFNDYRDVFARVGYRMLSSTGTTGVPATSSTNDMAFRVRRARKTI